ncbi:MAG: MORN repeat-containing protein [bacterium]
MVLVEYFGSIEDGKRHGFGTFRWFNGGILLILRCL